MNQLEYLSILQEFIAPLASQNACVKRIRKTGWQSVKEIVGTVLAIDQRGNKEALGHSISGNASRKKWIWG